MFEKNYVSQMFGFSGRALHTTLGWWPTDQVIASKDRSWKFDELSRRQLQCLPNVNSSNETAALINVKYTHWISCPNHSKNWKVKSAWKFHRIGRQQLPCMPYLSSGQPTELPTRKYFIKEGNSYFQICLVMVVGEPTPHNCLDHIMHFIIGSWVINKTG